MENSATKSPFDGVDNVNGGDMLSPLKAKETRDMSTVQSIEQVEQKVERIQSQRTANRDAAGRIKNLALDRRLQAEERQIVLEALGMVPEVQGGRYAAETGEMLSWLRS